jgi:hypothetical protein
MLAPELLAPVNNTNPNYTPIQHRQTYNGDGGGSGVGGRGAGQWSGNSNVAINGQQQQQQWDERRGGGFAMNDSYNSHTNNNGNNGFNTSNGGGRQGGGYGNDNNRGRDINNVSRYTDWNDGFGLENTLERDSDRPNGPATAIGNELLEGPRQRLGSKRGRDVTVDNQDSPPRTRSRQ